MKRTALLTLLLASYAAILGRTAAARMFRTAGFDPLAPQPSTVESLIVAGRFADALPLATQLKASYPKEPLVSYWLARINAGLNHPIEEAEAWEAFVRVSLQPTDACPAWPDAYRRAGRLEASRAAAERCDELIGR